MNNYALCEEGKTNTILSNLFLVQILIAKIIMATDNYMLYQTLEDIISINPLGSHAKQCLNGHFTCEKIDIKKKIK